MALREKYKKIQKNQASAESERIVSPEEALQAEKVKRDYEKLAAMETVKSCPVCFGSGIQHYEYNFVQKERTCENCDGEGLINPPKKVSEQNEATGTVTDDESDAPPCPL